MKNISRLIAGILAVIWLAGLSLPSLASDSDSELASLIIEQEKQEKKYKAAVEQILESMLGEGKFIVTVKVIIENEKKVIQSTEYKPTVEESPKDLYPGVPWPKGVEQKRPEIKSETVTMPALKNIMVSVIVDSKIFTKELEKQITTLVKDSLHLDDARGDVIEVKPAPFQTNPISAISKIGWVPIFAAVIVLTIIFFLFGPIRTFMNSLIRMMQTGRGREVSIDMSGNPALAGAGGGAVPGLGPGKERAAEGKAPGAEGEEGAVTTTTEEGEVVALKKGKPGAVFRPFSFIKKSNIANLVYLIQEESPETISLVMSYLSPDEAAEVMSQLPLELHGRVAKAMTSVKQASEESVAKAEASIKRRIDFLIGGLERFVAIIDRMDKETREEILTSLRRESPALAERVRREMFLFENIVDLDNTSVQTILRELKPENLAKALKDAPEKVINKVTSNISSGAARLLQEEMELNRLVTDGQAEEKRRKIVETIRQLEKEGKIAVKREKKKVEKVEKIERVGETEQETAGLRMAAPAASQQSVERKVSLGDYSGSGKRRVLSLSNVFRQSGKKSAEETSPEEKPVGSAAASPKPVAQEEQDYFQAGLGAYQGKQYDRAIDAFNRSIKQNPNRWQAYQYLGNCYFAKKMTKETVAAYEKSLQLNPNNQKLKEWLDAFKAKNV